MASMASMLNWRNAAAAGGICLLASQVIVLPKPQTVHAEASKDGKKASKNTAALKRRPSWEVKFEGPELSARSAGLKADAELFMSGRTNLPP